MTLYEIVKLGTNSFPPGQEGTDTAYLVRAATFDEAVAMVLPKIKVLADDFVAPAVDIVHVVGKDLSRGGQAMILWGPLFQTTSNRRWDSWHRSLYGNYWEAYPLARDGMAEAFYDNGQKAAEMHYDDWKEHGLTTRWYENGEMMFRGMFARGRETGLHEFWYSNGAKQQDCEYTRHGVTVTQWLEDGTLLKQYTNQWK